MTVMKSFYLIFFSDGRSESMEQDEILSMVVENEEMTLPNEEAVPCNHGSVNSEEAEDSENEYMRAEGIDDEDNIDNNRQYYLESSEDDDEGDDEDDDEDVREEEVVQAAAHIPSFQKRAIDNLPVTLKRGTTSNDFLLPILSASIRFNESYEQTLVHLRIIKSRLEHSTLPTTKKGLWASLDRDDVNITQHMYCYVCRGYLGTSTTLSEFCPCGSSRPGQDNSNVKYFLQINLTSQIFDFLRIPNIVESLEYRYSRVKQNIDTIEDIYDGTEYRNLSEPGGLLSYRYNYSFTFNTDGCKITNSSGVSGWPLYVQINELPPYLRSRHMLLAGIFVDDRHPPMNVFMKPFIDEMNALYRTGIIWHPTPQVSSVTSKFIVIIGTVDTPARPLLTRTKQFNGLYGCLYCYAEGMHAYGKRIYPVDQCFGRLRTFTDFKQHAIKAYQEKKEYFGVKGISSLVGLPEFDICKGMVVESMHALHLGVIKQHTKLLLTSVNAPFYIGSPNTKQQIDDRLLSVTFPKIRARAPRSLSTTPLWKASEWRNWMEIAPVCLEGILERKYVNHIALLSQAMYYLNNDAVSTQELDEAKRLLSQYVQTFQEYFGQENMSYNIHLMTHIAETANNWGPIWATDAYKFESWNRRIVAKVTSPHCRPEQIANRFLMAKFIDSIVWDDDVSEDTKSLIAEIRKVYRGHDGGIHNDFTGLGKAVKRSPTHIELMELRQTLGFEPYHMTCYKRAKIYGIKYYCTNKNKTKFSNSTIYSKDHGFGEILAIVEFEKDAHNIYGIFTNRLKVIRPAFFTQYMKEVVSTTETVFLEITRTIKPAVRVITSQKQYCYSLPNCWTSD